MPGCGQCRFPPLNCVPEGAWSPIGDVTTTMLWISHKISTAGRRLGNNSRVPLCSWPDTWNPRAHCTPEQTSF